MTAVNKVSELIRKAGILFILVIVLLVGRFTSESFFTSENLVNILRQVVVVGILAYGENLLIISGEFDMSPSSVLALCGVIAALVNNATGSAAVAFLVALLVGSAFGLFNGVVINYLGLPTFIVTLAVQYIARGLAYIVTEGLPVNIEGESFRILGQGNLFGVIPYNVIVLFIMFGISWLILNRTLSGRYLYAIGCNVEAAYAAGVHVKRVKTLMFTYMGLLTGMSGYILMSRVNSGVPSSGTNYDFDAMIGAVIGGSSFSGGTGTMLGALIGVIIVAVINNILVMLSVSAYMQNVVKGIVILIAMLIDTMNSKNRLKR